MRCAGGDIGDRHHFSLWKSCFESTGGEPAKKGRKTSVFYPKRGAKGTCGCRRRCHTLQMAQEEVRKNLYDGEVSIHQLEIRPPHPILLVRNQFPGYLGYTPTASSGGIEVSLNGCPTRCTI